MNRTLKTTAATLLALGALTFATTAMARDHGATGHKNKVELAQDVTTDALTTQDEKSHGILPKTGRAKLKRFSLATTSIDSGSDESDSPDSSSLDSSSHDMSGEDASGSDATDDSGDSSETESDSSGS